jgi:dihydrofolate synthase/folylpolyglutamate synthase
VIFTRAAVDTWILEVGLGGRLDAVNLIDPDFSLITTVALDHQEWLGDTLDQIATEKAGILRAGTPGFFGDRDCPQPIEASANQLGTRLNRLGRDFDCQVNGDRWAWRGAEKSLPELPLPDFADAAQLSNLSLALAAVEAYEPELLNRRLVEQALAGGPPPGRFQLAEREHQWVLDVAHNPQAAQVLAQRLRRLGDGRDTTAIVGMLADKQAEAFVAELAGDIDRWIVCALPDPRAADPAMLAATVARVTGHEPEIGARPEAAFALAERLTGAGGRILVCGSFRIVGPALRWLGLY